MKGSSPIHGIVTEYLRLNLCGQQIPSMDRSRTYETKNVRNGFPNYAENKIQVGNVVLLAGNHARGNTAYVFLVKDADNIRGNAMEVYGITGGQPGWTETYGWKHRGSWCQEVIHILKVMKHQIDARRAQIKSQQDAWADQKNQKIAQDLVEFERMFS